MWYLNDRRSVLDLRFSTALCNYVDMSDSNGNEHLSFTCRVVSLMCPTIGVYGNDRPSITENPCFSNNSRCSLCTLV